MLMLTCCMRSASEKTAKPNENIILINIEQFENDPEKISHGISILSSLESKVIALKFQFTEESYGQRIDSILMNSLSSCEEKLVLGLDVENYLEVLEEYSRFKKVFFVPTKSKVGYSTLVGDIDPFGTIKSFTSWERVNGKIEYQFAVEVAMLFDSAKANKFIKKHPKVNDIDFHEGAKFKSLDLNDILNGKILPSDIKGRIVILGFLGPGFTDRYYSAAIQRGNGSFEPDMYGVEIQAHIVLQILSE